MENNSFYREVVNDHNLRPAHKRPLPDANLELRGVNPSCGDDITLRLRVEDGVVADGAFTGDGCAVAVTGDSTVFLNNVTITGDGVIRG